MSREEKPKQLKCKLTCKYYLYCWQVGYTETIRLGVIPKFCDRKFKLK